MTLSRQGMKIWSQARFIEARQSIKAKIRTR